MGHNSMPESLTRFFYRINPYPHAKSLKYIADSPSQSLKIEEARLPDHGLTRFLEETSWQLDKEAPGEHS